MSHAPRPSPPLMIMSIWETPGPEAHDPSVAENGDTSPAKLGRNADQAE